MSVKTSPGSAAAALEAGIARGLRAVAGRLGSAGQWPSRRHERADRRDEGRHETSPFVTALGVLALAGVDDSVAEAIRRRSATHLVATMHSPGLWRYYRDLPFDLDTSSIAALALERRHPWLREGRNVPPLLAGRTEDGRFRTWLLPGRPNAGEIDVVVNANAVALLGERRETVIAVRWVADVAERRRAQESSWYYRDSLDLTLAIQRAADADVGGLRGAAHVCAVRAAARVEGDAAALSPHRLSQAIIAASWDPSACDPAALAHARARLLACQLWDGSWPAGLLYVGAEPPAPPIFWFSSQTVTTALCTRALRILSARARPDSGRLERRAPLV
ncbi:MAG: hypothetical protein ICV69_08465 [Thermoleophilaceae bacterium]|nr:hypothetical protein [Thermoleophilaceae bacterium]